MGQRFFFLFLFFKQAELERSIIILKISLKPYSNHRTGEVLKAFFLRLEIRQWYLQLLTIILLEVPASGIRQEED